MPSMPFGARDRKNRGQGDVVAPLQAPAIGWGPTIAAVIVAIALFVLYLPVFAHAIDLWSVDEELSFGFAMPLVSVGLLWLRRETIRRSLGRGAWAGLPLILCGMALLVVDMHSSIRAIGGASFLLTALGALTYLYGVKTARVSFFPIMFLTIGLSLYRGLFVPIGFQMQGITARYSAQAASLLGVPMRRNGVDLYAGNFHFVVAEACSGMNSLLALLCLGILIAGLAQSALPRRLLLLLLILPIVLVANIARVTLVLVLSQVVGLAVVDSFIHGAFDAVIFLIAFGLFFLVGKVLKCYPRIGAMALS